MNVLALDTSSRRRTVCVVATAAGDLVHAEVRDDVSVGEAVPRSLAAMVGAEIGAVVVVVGPGSYTGLRAGMAAALGVAEARGVPLHGVGTLEVTAAGCTIDGVPQVWAVADAGRGGLYVAMCTRRDGGWQVGGTSREPFASLDLRGLVAVSADAIEIPGLTRVDPAAALARAVPLALSRPALPAAGLAAVYVG